MRNRLAYLVIVLLTVCTAQAQAYSSMFVFGDSLSDNGNNAVALGQPPFNIPQSVAPFQNGGSPAPFVPVGSYFGSNNYSNGPVWVDYLGAALGLPVVPALAGGTNFAYGGAVTGPLGLPSDLDPIPNLEAQAAGAVAVLGGTLPSDALYVVWGGGNDIRGLGEAYGADLASPDVPTQQQALLNLQNGVAQSVANLLTTLGTLTNAGARNFLIPNLPDLGITPIARFAELHGAPGTQQTLTNLSLLFNSELAGAIAAAQGTPGLSLTAIDIFALNHAVVDPQLPGINVTEACTSQNNFTGCTDPQNFVYWDGIHPTTATHQLIAAAALQALPPAAVPVPASLPLAVGGIVMLAGVARRRRAA